MESEVSQFIVLAQFPTSKHEKVKAETAVSFSNIDFPWLLASGMDGSGNSSFFFHLLLFGCWKFGQNGHFSKKWWVVIPKKMRYYHFPVRYFFLSGSQYSQSNDGTREALTKTSKTTLSELHCPVTSFGVLHAYMYWKIYIIFEVEVAVFFFFSRLHGVRHWEHLLLWQNDLGGSQCPHYSLFFLILVHIHCNFFLWKMYMGTYPAQMLILSDSIQCAVLCLVWMRTILASIKLFVKVVVQPFSWRLI